MRQHSNRLSWCGKCKEKSVTRRVYIRKSDGERVRVEYCINKGCGYRLELPILLNRNEEGE